MDKVKLDTRETFSFMQYVTCNVISYAKFELYLQSININADEAHLQRSLIRNACTLSDVILHSLDSVTCMTEEAAVASQRQVKYITTASNQRSRIE
jgi:hypothetical protein